MKVVVAGLGKTGSKVFEYLKSNTQWQIFGYDGKGEKPEDFVIWVDFTTPTAVVENAKYVLVEEKKNMVIGTTGFDYNLVISMLDKENQSLFIAPNFSVGANLMIIFSRMASKFFKKAHIVERHNSQKKDKPSGTAKFTAEILKENGVEIDSISSMRMDVFNAWQDVIFGENDEILTISHNALNRIVYGFGVKLAIDWCLKNKGVHIGLDSLIEELLK